MTTSELKVGDSVLTEDYHGNMVIREILWRDEKYVLVTPDIEEEPVVLGFDSVTPYRFEVGKVYQEKSRYNPKAMTVVAYYGDQAVVVWNVPEMGRPAAGLVLLSSRHAYKEVGAEI